MGKIIRPFLASAKIGCRQYSTHLQRAITDFEAESAFNKIPERIQEHYGFTIPISSTQVITLTHAHEMAAAPLQENTSIKNVSQLIPKTDGSMVPIVEIKEKHGVTDGVRYAQLVGKKLDLL